MLRKWLTFRTISIALAILLATTAILKLHMLLTDPFADIKTGLPKYLFVSLIAFEACAVSCLFFFGNNPDESTITNWWLLIVMFITFFFVSIAKTILGHDNCGCTGMVTVPPLAMAGVDLFVIGLLFCYRPICGFDVVKPPTLIMSFAKFWTGAFLGIASSISFLVAFHSDTLFRKQSLVVEPVNIGTRSSFDPVIANVLIKNISDSSVKLIGVTRSCGCLDFGSLNFPVEIPPQDVLEITVRITPKKKGIFWQRVVFFVDLDEQSFVQVEFSGQFWSDANERFISRNGVWSVLVSVYDCLGKFVKFDRGSTRSSACEGVRNRSRRRM